MWMDKEAAALATQPWSMNRSVTDTNSKEGFISPRGNRGIASWPLEAQGGASDVAQAEICKFISSG